MKTRSAANSSKYCARLHILIKCDQRCLVRGLYGAASAPANARNACTRSGALLDTCLANDGITAAIDLEEKVVAQLPQFQEGVLRASVQPMTGLTPYARFGNYPVVLGALSLLAIRGLRRRAG